MNLSQLNALTDAERREALLKCCGASAWADKMCLIFPVTDRETLLKDAERIWFGCREEDWREAFLHHPKIGDLNALKEKFAATHRWAEGEQASVRKASDEVLEALAAGNRLYEEKFGYIFIVCATGKTAEEMLQLLEERLPNAPEKEIKIAMKEQNKITLLRLQKLVSL